MFISENAPNVRDVGLSACVIVFQHFPSSCMLLNLIMMYSNMRVYRQCVYIAHFFMRKCLPCHFGKGAEQHNTLYQCFYNFYPFLMLNQDTFSLCTYWRKCILFEIKMIKDYQYSQSLWECGVLGGEHRLYNRKNYLNWEALPPSPPFRWGFRSHTPFF